MDLLLRIAPFFLIIAAGAAAGRVGFLNARLGGWLSAYTFWIGFPALLVRWLGDAPLPDASLARALTAYGGAMACVLFAAPFIGRTLKFPREASAAMAMTSAVGNTAFLGAPLAVSVFGEAVRAPAAAVVAVDFIALMALSIAILQTGKPGGHLAVALRRVLLNPTVAGAALGLAFSALHVRLPVVVDRPLSWLAATASPVALVALGGLIGRERDRPSRADAGPLSLALFLKLAMAPALVWSVLGLAGADGDVRAAFTLLAACPTAVNVFIQTRALDIYARGSALIVVLGAVISAASLSLLAFVLGG